MVLPYAYFSIGIAAYSSLFAWDAYFNRGMPIFTVKMGIRMPIFYSVLKGVTPLRAAEAAKQQVIRVRSRKKGLSY